MNGFKEEVKRGQRFEFGKNWQSFLSTLDDERIKSAEDSIKEMLEVDNLKDKTFLDIGSGSGLSSLAARRLGATGHSFDYDPLSVACAQEIRSRYFHDDPAWIVKQGSVLDRDFLQSLGNFDIVYAWGVLHHTGNMWEALGNATSLVKAKGILFVAIYNDQGRRSKCWWTIKKCYCSGVVGKIVVCSLFIPYFFLRAVMMFLLKKKNIFSEYKKRRGMSIIHDWLDWLGGFPFEVARVDEVFHFVKAKGFTLENIKIGGEDANNQFVFAKCNML